MIESPLPERRQSSGGLGRQAPSDVLRWQILYMWRGTLVADAPRVDDPATVAPECEDTMLQQHPMYAYLPARDIDRARRFYEKTLGFRPGEETGSGVTYRCADGTACFVYPTPRAGTSQASQAFWKVPDIEREVAELRSRGVTIEHYDVPGGRAEGADPDIITAGGARAAWFKDSEGNILALIQEV